MNICNEMYVASFPAHTSILKLRSISSNSLSSINLSPSSVISNAMEIDAKKLKQIAAELRKASAMHKSQAVRIDKMLKSLKTKAKK